MARVALDRSQNAVVAGGTVYLCQARELGRVTGRGAGAVGLDQAYRVGVHARGG